MIFGCGDAGVIVMYGGNEWVAKEVSQLASVNSEQKERGTTEPRLRWDWNDMHEPM